MASTPSSASQLNQLKTKLKTWERQFKAMEGRAPSKADIKANPEIAKMYSAYNSSRKGPSASEEAPYPSSSSRSNNQPQVLSTPKSNIRPGSSRSRVVSQETNNISPSKTYAHANSPSKIRKLVQEHSPRKAHYDRLRSKSSTTTSFKNTPAHQRRHNPFELDSGGGTGSPALFADLLLESKKETPRTKARKFIEGIGSPLKPRSNTSGFSNPGSQSLGAGLSSFIKARPNQSLDKSSQVITSDNLQDEDDEVLGPSPFKPASSNVFRPLFDEPEAEPDDHSLSPSKMIKSKWKITSSTPFISQSQNDTPDGLMSSNPTAPQCAQKDPDQSGKKKGFGFGTKRKRLILPGEEDPSFYQDLPDPDSHNVSKNRASNTLLNKKKRVEKADKQPSSKTQTTGEGRKAKTKAQLMVKKGVAKPMQESTKLSSDHSEESGDESTVLPDLPFGNPDQSAVYTELETFTFTKPEDVMTDERNKGKKACSTENGVQVAKGQEKGAGKGAPLAKPVKVGTRKVLVRAYRPIEPGQMTQTLDPDSLVDVGSSGSHDLDDAEEMLDEEEEEEEEAAEEWDEDETFEDEEDEDLEEDEDGIPESLMNILNLEEEGLTKEGSERRELLRERWRERKVRKILDGMTLMEKTLTDVGSTSTGVAMQGVAAMRGGSKSVAGGGRGSKKVVATGKKASWGTQTSILRAQDSVEEELRFELALDQLELDQQLDYHGADLDDEWDDEPVGWKDERLDPLLLSHYDDDSLDNQFVL
ncbi:hypothetical protein VP01_2802g3 [Puccinia sorghi]|uniref:DNA replication regulator SLD2 n=1 Tax=Puccinia sorghi TaxID=27349 RepID=A0A0L6V2I0_9BASI|nr:hypothetical protein VP01_2802g3 [Puccinia sorghi]